MELISHEEFGRLRLSQFVQDASTTDELEDWEYMDCLWVGEAIGFTEWLRYQDEPETLGCISLDLEALPAEVEQKILSHIHLPLHRGMDYTQVVGVLGEPDGVQEFVAEQKSYEFNIGSASRYLVDCTIHQGSGLKYITVVALEPDEAQLG